MRIPKPSWAHDRTLDYMELAPPPDETLLPTLKRRRDVVARTRRGLGRGAKFTSGDPTSLVEQRWIALVEQGLVEKINEKTGKNEGRAAYLARIRTECLDEEQWLQEYCCIPADEASAFISYQMINACEDPNLRLMSLEQLTEYCLEHSNAT